MILINGRWLKILKGIIFAFEKIFYLEKQLNNHQSFLKYLSKCFCFFYEREQVSTIKCSSKGNNRKQHFLVYF